MKVNVTCSGCEITVEEVDGKCVVTALQDGEVVEEFTVDCDGSESGEEFEEEEFEDDVENDVEEFEDDVEDDVEEFEEEDEEVSESVKSFGNFFKKSAPKKQSRSNSASKPVSRNRTTTSKKRK